MIFVEQHDTELTRRHPTDLIHPLNYLDFKLRADNSARRQGWPTTAFPHRHREPPVGPGRGWATTAQPTRSTRGRAWASPGAPEPWGVARQHPLSGGARVQSRQAELPGRGPPPSSQGRRGAVTSSERFRPSCRSGGRGGRGAPLPQPGLPCGLQMDLSAAK